MRVIVEQQVSLLRFPLIGIEIFLSISISLRSLFTKLNFMNGTTHKFLKDASYSIYLVLISIILSCSKDEEPAVVSCISGQIVNRLEMVEGEVLLVFETWCIEVTNGTRMDRYFDCNFPDHLKVEGSSLIFDAYEFAIPPNVRLLGTPISITRVY